MLLFGKCFRAELFLGNVPHKDVWSGTLPFLKLDKGQVGTSKQIRNGHAFLSGELHFLQGQVTTRE